MNELKDKPFALIGVHTISNDAKKLKAVMEKEQLNWLSIANTDAIKSRWNNPGTPAYYIIDRKGVIRHKWVGNPGGRTLDTALQELIAAASEK